MSLWGVLRYLWRNATTRPDMLKRGDLAPEFDAVDHNGGAIRLVDLRGSKVVLWFYPKADTPG